MVQLKPFKTVEPSGGDSEAATLPSLSEAQTSHQTAPPFDSQGSTTKSDRYLQEDRHHMAETDKPQRQQLEDANAAQATHSKEALAKLKKQSSHSTNSIASTASEASRSPSTIIGGNLTTDTSSLSSATVRSSGAALVEPAASHQKRPEETGDSSTLSSNEEYQSARLDLGNEHEEDDDDDGHEEDKFQAQDTTNHQNSLVDRANVTKIDIEHNRNGSLIMQQQQTHRQANGESPLATPPPRHFNQQVITNSTSKGPLTPRLRQHMLTKSSTSPSFLNQLVGKSPQLNRGKFNSHEQADSASQYSFPLQFKYQGSNHFEIRWQNIRLYAKPKSRVPSFISESSIYRALFGKADEPLAKDAASSSMAVDDPFKPPYSPPLSHYKVPPTIDENLEMNCPHAVGKEASLNESPTRSVPIGNAVGGFEISPSQGLGKATPPLQDANSTQTARCILNNISGQVFSGQMTAILGPSGVGKTSLLNSLTGRNTMDGTGRVGLLGANNNKRMSVVTVPQVDVLPNKLTTWEDLNFTSLLKNPQSGFNHARNIERLVKHLHMEKFLHTKIDKLSGGEARRLSIARELLSNPDILILDEPTSGLDANTCKKIITALRDIVEHTDNIMDKPMSIIITIHQPQQEVYQLFHRVYVMAIGGLVVYEGSPQMLLPTILEQSSLTRIWPSDQLNENPAVVAIEVASGEYGPQIIEELANYHERQVYEEFSAFGGALGGNSTESPLLTPRSLRPNKSPMSVSRMEMRKRLNSIDSSIGRPTPILRRHLNSPLPPNQLDRMSSITSISYDSTYDADLPEPSSKLKVDKRLRRSVVMKSHFFSHTLTLIRRCWLLTTRDIFLMSIRILGYLLVAGGTVQIFSHALDPNDHQCPKFETDIDDMHSYIGEVRNRMSGLLVMLRQGNSTHLFFFHLLLCITMVTSALTGLVFPLQMRMFIREYKNGWYSPASFIMSQTIAELPADLVGPIVTLLISYPLCHQPDSAYHWRMIAYAAVLALTSIICKSQAQIVGAFLMDSVENSVFISCVCVSVPALLSGVPLRIEQMIAPLQMISYGSFLRYSFECLLELRYGYGMCPCDPEVVHGPLQASPQAIPTHLESLASGFLELSLPRQSNFTDGVSGQNLGSTATAMVTSADALGSSEHENIFLSFLKLVTDAGNLFTRGTDIHDCSSYRSLYLINMSIGKNTFSKWIVVMLLMFVISRVLTYFVVKTVIKLRRS